METAILLQVFIAGVLFVYFMPTIFAIMRGHRNRLAIFVANLLLGWSIIVWVVLIIWSFTKNIEENA